MISSLISQWRLKIQGKLVDLVDCSSMADLCIHVDMNKSCDVVNTINPSSLTIAGQAMVNVESFVTKYEYLMWNVCFRIQGKLGVYQRSTPNKYFSCIRVAQPTLKQTLA